MSGPLETLDSLRAYQMWAEFCDHPCFGLYMAELARLIEKTRTDEDGLYAGQAIEISAQRGRRAALVEALHYPQTQRTALYEEVTQA